MSRLPYSTPEAQGIPSAAISTLISAFERDIDTVHSFILLRHGHIVAEGWWEPYQPEFTHSLFSLSKSFTSTAVGMLVAEGRLSVDDFVLSFFPDDAPPNPSDNLKAMRVRHLLTMSTGHATEPDIRFQIEQTWVQGFLAHPVKHEPGTHFLYNSIATYMLSAIVSKLTGELLIDYLRPRLFEPLGIKNPMWEVSPQWINTGGWGLNITTEDIAVFGQFYLQKGVWQGKRLLPEAWVEEATAYQMNNEVNTNPDWKQGYGYQFWRCHHNAYRGDGAFGQYCVVMPDQDAVLAITGGLDDMQLPLDLVWEHLLPAMESAPLPDDAAAQNALKNQLNKLQICPPQGSASAPIAARVSGQTYQIETNDEGIQSLRFDFEETQTVLTLHDQNGEHQLRFGFEQWIQQSVVFHPRDSSMIIAVIMNSGAWKIAASGAWMDATTYIAKLWWVETPFSWTLTCHIDDGYLIVEQRANQGFSALKGANLQGKKI